MGLGQSMGFFQTRWDFVCVVVDKDGGCETNKERKLFSIYSRIYDSQCNSLVCVEFRELQPIDCDEPTGHLNLR